MPSVSIEKQRRIEQQVRQVRDSLLAECGWNVEKRRKMLTKAMNRLNEQLDAEKAIVTKEEVLQVPDNSARLRAIEQVVDLEGVSLGKQHEGGSGGPTTIVVNANWFEAGPTTGSGEGTVVEIGPANLLESKES